MTVSPFCCFVYDLDCLFLFLLIVPFGRALYGMRGRPTLYCAEHYSLMGRALRSPGIEPYQGLVRH